MLIFREQPKKAQCLQGIGLKIFLNEKDRNRRMTVRQIGDVSFQINCDTNLIVPVVLNRFNTTKSINTSC